MINVVLYQPEIPQNTGNIVRLCMASGAVLHLIKPYGFVLNEKHLKRAAMDYILEAEIHEYTCWEEFMATNQPKNIFFLTRYGHRAPGEFRYDELEGDIWLVFGKESTGIPKHILKDHMDHGIRLPMVAEARSLNLSNCVAIMVYEVLRQLDYPGLARDEVLKGPDFVERNQWDEDH
ncbi:MAG: tRNA (cytidine(34)-2'-O)-methyltransferase [Erysipelotrichaceae bacterium]|nr:tRNA (cytidine(34)-2'-O)-methyltransferase [Erysipelotrichaceae bacterium]